MTGVQEFRAGLTRSLVLVTNKFLEEGYLILAGYSLTNISSKRLKVSLTKFLFAMRSVELWVECYCSFNDIQVQKFSETEKPCIAA